MSIDPKGVAPGLPSQAQKKDSDLVHMKCRSSYVCDSMTATIIRTQGQAGPRMYRCSKCQHTWGINLGGHFQF